jgi:protein TonB
MFTSTTFPPSNPRSPEEAYFKAQLAGYASQYGKYPIEACKAKQEGDVTVALFIDQSGAFVREELRKSSGFALLDEEALATWKRVREAGGRLDVAKDKRFGEAGVIYTLQTQFRLK